MAPGPLALVTLVACLCIFLSAAHVEALPTVPDHVLSSEDPQTFKTTKHTTDTNGNPIVVKCVVKFTPSTMNGEENVIVVSTCVQMPDTSAGGGGTETTPTGSTVTTTSTSGMDTPTSTPPKFSTPPAFTTSTPKTSTPSTDTPTSTTPTPPDFTSPTPNTTTPGTATNGGVLNLGTSSVPASPLRIGLPTTTSTSSTDTTRTSPTPAPTGTEAAASGTPAGAINTGLPGKSISVLPIGLGVFAGLSVIAMIVVGAVTYERTKYRKNFRAQRLAEAGGEMGYGGMAQSRV